MLSQASMPAQGHPHVAGLGPGGRLPHMQWDALTQSCQTRVYLLPSLGSDAVVWRLWSWVHALSALSCCLERWWIAVGIVLACRR